MEAAPVERRTQRVIPRFVGRMTRVRYHEQSDVEEYLFALALGDAMLFIFASVSIIPIEADNALEVDHPCILPSYTRTCQAKWTKAGACGTLASSNYIDIEDYKQ